MHDCEPKSDPLRPHRHVGFENIGPFRNGDARAVIANFQNRLAGADRRQLDFYTPPGRHGLQRIQQDVEQCLPEQLLIGLDDKRCSTDLYRQILTKRLEGETQRDQ